VAPAICWRELWDPRRAASAARVLAGSHRRIDLGTVEIAGVSRYFAVACGTASTPA
jgi:hypothetical protein